MTEGVGLSVGATNLTAVVVDRAAVTRSPVLTLYPHRPSEVGVPSENPDLNERGLIITDFVDRVGDPVGIVASDGSTHRADGLLADALRAMLFAVGRGRPPADPVAVTYPAHWRSNAVAALRNALAAVPQFQGSKPAPVVSDATAALTALQRDPGVPSRGVIAVCDFGGTGTSITLVDAANGFQPIGETVRHTDFSGDLIDQALLTHVINDLSAAGTIDLSGTSAIGSLTRLRGQCRGAKERLSTAAVTSLAAELPGRGTDVRLTRNELDDAIRQPLADFVGVLQETVDRSGIRGADLVAVASVGGGARTPIITTTLSEHFRVPVITTANPELTAAIGGGLAAARGTVEEGMTSMAAAPAAAAAAAMGAEEEPTVTGSATVQALAWSEADDIPDLAPTDPYDYVGEADTGGVTDARPPMQFDREPYEEEAAAPLPWYRRPAVVAGVGLLALLAALTAAVLFVLRNDSAPTPASTTTPVTTTPTPTPTPSTTVAAPPPPPPPPVTQAPPPRTRTVTREAPPPVIQTQAPPPPPTHTEAPPPPPPTHTEAPPPTEPPPPTDPPPATEPPLIPTIPPITLFPGGPTIPIGPQPPAP